LIGFEPVIDQVPYVHHIILYADNSGDCSEDIGQIIHVWAFGAGTYALPQEAGFKVGPNGFNVFRMEVHYDNRSLDEGVIDNSAFYLYWTRSLRQNDAGVFSIADPAVELQGKKVGDGVSRHIFQCPSTCTSYGLQGGDVTVFSEMLHMHETGVYMTNSQVRGGNEIRKAVVDYYDFDQVGGYLVQQSEFTIQPGDSFKTACHYNTDDSVEFGLGSKNEMCIAYLTYYPSLPMQFGCGVEIFPLFPVCDVEYSQEILASEDKLGRVFGTMNMFLPTQTPTTRSQPTSKPNEEPTGMPLTQSTSKPNEELTLSPTQLPPNEEPSGMPLTQPTSKPNEELALLPTQLPVSPSNSSSDGSILKSGKWVGCLLILGSIMV